MVSFYKSNEELDIFRSDHLFKIKKGDHVTFYYAPLQMVGGSILAALSIKHMTMVIQSARSPNKQISLGFYPNDGNIYGALFSPKEGYIWSPDPHYILNKVEAIMYYNTNIPIQYKLTKQQSNYFNNRLDDKLTRLKDGSTSNAIIKRDRLECPTLAYEYCPIPRKTQHHNCVSYLYAIFPNLETHVEGTFDQVLDNLNIR